MRIRWAEPAASDLTNICDYIRDHDAPGTARRVALTIYESVKSLARFPHRGRPGRRQGTRELVLPPLPFLAIYRIRGDVIEILRILHGAQSWP
ncbi:MAG TPA: type II toxin-antitoxin system RelE/ParE family toxin [Terriglobia bacterium]|nr:type II toxin-antitoxin system RelE/ParE family toxin [Terriglobia bacterium]